MEVNVIKLDGKSAGKLALSDVVFGVEPREDILQRTVRWQLAKRQQGTHKSKGRSEISRTGAKMFKQKGTGRARASSARVPQHRGGGKAHGPQVRSHAHDLTKKFRALALRHALSSKLKSEALVVIDDIHASEPKAKSLAASLSKAGLDRALFIGGSEIDANFKKAASNIMHVDVLPVQGINVYDILKCDKLVLSKAAVEALEERYK